MQLYVQGILMGMRSRRYVLCQGMYVKQRSGSVVEVVNPGVAEVAPLLEDASGIELHELLVDLDGHLQACLHEVEREVALQAVHLGEAQLRPVFLLLVVGHHGGSPYGDEVGQGLYVLGIDSLLLLLGASILGLNLHHRSSLYLCLSFLLRNSHRRVFLDNFGLILASPTEVSSKPLILSFEGMYFLNEPFHPALFILSQLPSLLDLNSQNLILQSQNNPSLTYGDELHLIPFILLPFVCVFGEFYQPINEIQFYLFNLLPVVQKHESIQLAYRLPQLRVQHVFNAILSPEWRGRYLPSICLEMSAQRLPYLACNSMRKFSSWAVHFSLLIPLRRWLWYRSLHCFPLRAGMPNCSCMMREISLHLRILRTSKSYLRIQSSWVGRELYLLLPDLSLRHLRRSKGQMKDIDYNLFTVLRLKSITEIQKKVYPINSKRILHQTSNHYQTMLAPSFIFFLCFQTFFSAKNVIIRKKSEEKQQESAPGQASLKTVGQRRLKGRRWILLESIKQSAGLPDIHPATSIVDGPCPYQHSGLASPRLLYFLKKRWPQYSPTFGLAISNSDLPIECLKERSSTSMSDANVRSLLASVGEVALHIFNGKVYEKWQCRAWLEGVGSGGGVRIKNGLTNEITLQQRYHYQLSSNYKIIPMYILCLSLLLLLPTIYSQQQSPPSPSCGCLNGGTCMSSTSLLCHCPAGFIGATCHLRATALPLDKISASLSTNYSYFYFQPSETNYYRLSFTICMQSNPSSRATLFYLETEKNDGSLRESPSVFETAKIMLADQACSTFSTHYISVKRREDDSFRKIVIGFKALHTDQTINQRSQQLNSTQQLAQDQSSVELQEWEDAEDVHQQITIKMASEIYLQNSYVATFLILFTSFVLLLIIVSFITYLRRKFAIDSLQFELSDALHLQADLERLRRELQNLNPEDSRPHTKNSLQNLEIFMPVTHYGTPQSIFVPHLLANKQQSSFEGQACSICLVELQAGDDIRTTPCRHIYHRECIDSWCQTRLSCPICRRGLDFTREMRQLYYELLRNDLPL